MDTTITRTEHVAWCKQRAYAYLNRGDWFEAMGSFISDLGKHPDQGDMVQRLGTMMLLGGHINDVASARKFIDGTN